MISIGTYTELPVEVLGVIVLVEIVIFTILVDEATVVMVLVVVKVVGRLLFSHLIISGLISGEGNGVNLSLSLILLIFDIIEFLVRLGPHFLKLFIRQDRNSICCK